MPERNLKKSENGVWSDWPPGTELLGEYKVLRKLGQGGMGTVFLVAGRRDPDLQYAVKTLIPERTLEYADRKALLQEMRTWFDLPEHPNITACRFFRTIQDRMCIFADYVSGGSLHDWIRNGRITSLEQVIQIAVQSAWGLQTAHDWGVIHQDIKPANILMTEHGVPRITDFGLSKAQPGIPLGDLPRMTTRGTVMVSSAGMTVAYCSPEQAMGEKLTRRTDQWSWALTVLEMLLGDRPWKIGAAAPAILDQWETNPVRPAVTGDLQPVLTVLARCFQGAPAERWPTMTDAASALIKLYPAVTGAPFPLTAPATRQREPDHDTVPRRTHRGEEWEDPKIWLVKALEDSRRPLDEMEKLLPPRRGSWQAQLMVDLEIYEEALRIYDEMHRAGRNHVLAIRAKILQQKAQLLSLFTDQTGAGLALDESIRILSDLMSAEPDKTTARSLIAARAQKGYLLFGLQDLNGAEANWKRAIQLIQQWFNSAEDREYFYMETGAIAANRAIALFCMNRHAEGKSILQDAIASYLAGIQSFPKPVNRLKLAVAYANYGNMVNQDKLYGEAMSLFRKSLDLLQNINDPDLAVRVAVESQSTYQRIAHTQLAAGEYSDALDSYNRCIDIQRKLVKSEKMDHMRKGLADAIVNMLAALNAMNMERESLAAADEAIGIYLDLIQRAGQNDERLGLAVAYRKKANALHRLNQAAESVEISSRAVALLQEIPGAERQLAAMEHLAYTLHSRGHALRDMARLDEAAADYERAVAIWRELVADGESTAEYRDNLLLAKLYFTEVQCLITDSDSHKKVLAGLFGELKTRYEATGAGLLGEELEDLRARYPFLTGS